MNTIIFDGKRHQIADIDLAISVAQRCNKTAKVFNDKGVEVFRQWHDRKVPNPFRRPAFKQADVRAIASGKLTQAEIHAIFDR